MNYRQIWLHLTGRKREKCNWMQSYRIYEGLAVLNLKTQFSHDWRQQTHKMHDCSNGSILMFGDDVWLAVSQAKQLFLYKSWLLKTQEELVLFAWNCLHRKEIIMKSRSYKPLGREWAHPPCKKGHKPYVSLLGDAAQNQLEYWNQLEDASRHLPKQPRIHKESCFFPSTVSLH